MGEKKLNDIIDAADTIYTYLALIMSRFFRQADDSDSDTEESEDELMSSGDEAPPKPTTSAAKPAMSRFLRTAGSDSSSESSEDDTSDNDSDLNQRSEDSGERETDDEDKPNTRILSAQERRLAEMESTGKIIDNGLKNDDWVAISNGRSSHPSHWPCTDLINTRI